MKMLARTTNSPHEYSMFHRTFPSALLAALFSLGGTGPGLFAGENVPLSERPEAPQAPTESDFAALRKTSPFTRVLSLSETYALRGVAKIDEKQVATLYNRETKKTIVVTPEGDNELGLALVEVVPASELEEVAAKISFAGDEAELKYALDEIFPQPGASGRDRGDRGRRGRRGPSPQDIERYKSLSEENQGKLREYIGHVMRNYPEMSRQEKGNLIRGAMIRLGDGRDIEVPPASAEAGATGGGESRSRERGGESRSRERGGNRERR